VRRLAALLACAAGCGPSSFADFRDQLAARSCDRAVRCGVVGASERDGCPVPPELAAIATAGLDVGAEVDAGRMRFTSSRAQECLDAVAAAPCAAGALVARINLHCHNVIGPKVAPRGECRGDGECSGGFCLRAGCPGACVAWPSPGDACTPPQGCDPTVQYCGVADGGYACLRHKQEGDACEDTSECAFGLLCIAAKCSTPPRGGQPGAPCDGPGACDESLYCDGATQRCTVHAGLGAACAQADACTDGFACVGLTAVGSTGTCTAWLDVGQACGVAAGAVTGCPASQACAGGQCALVAPAQAGDHAPCDARPCVPGLVCGTTQRCGFPAGVGARCDAQTMCAAGLACDATMNVCVGASGVCSP
jgi:hypothetical protein